MTHPPEQLYEGPITITRRGTGFFSIDPEAPKEEDLLIEPEHLNKALPGDTVRVAPAGVVVDRIKGTERKAGRVVEIVTRAHENFVGTLAANDEPGAPADQIILIPDNKRLYVPFIVRSDNPPLGKKVLLKFEGWDAGDPYPWGTVSEVIGTAGDHDTEMRALALGQGFRSDFPPGVVQEAEALETTGAQMLADEAEQSIKAGSRRDFRSVTTFTIDPYDAKDFDDALSVRKLENGHLEVGVHIADVSHFVRPGTAIDNEARNRATSVYLVDRTIPMLPEVLSNNLCSLNPDVDRLAVSAVFTLDAQAGIIDRWFGPTVIHSDKRFTYEDAQEVLDAGTGMLHDDLAALRDLSRLIRARRVAKGAIEFDTPEVKVKLDETGKPIAIELKERKETNLLIEDFMLLANEAVAEHISAVTKNKKDSFSIYRIHDVPNAERIEDLASFLRVLGYKLETHGGNVKGADINALLDKVKGTPEEYLIKMATLRSMAKAVYATRNIGHFGLAFAYYTHFTSPIRRYPDLLIHRMIKSIAAGGLLSQEQMDEFDALALHSSEREVAATEAERDSIKMKQVEFLADKIGQEFDAVISGVSDRGLYVEEKETHADGMIRINSIGDDYYEYDQKRYRLVGRRTKKEYALGDPIRVKLIAARVFERELDFAIVT